MRKRSVLAWVLLAVPLSGCGGGSDGEPSPQAGAVPDHRALAGLREQVGQNAGDARPWETEPLRGRLEALLGERHDRFLESLDETGPVSVTSNGSIVYFTAIRRGEDLTASAVIVEPSRNVVNVILKINLAAQQFTEGEVSIETPPEVDAFFTGIDADLYGTRDEKPVTAKAGKKPVKARPTQEIYRGYLAIGPDLRTFMDCAEFRNSWVVDDTPDGLEALHESLGAQSFAPVFAEVSGWFAEAPVDVYGAGFDLQLTVTEVLRAYPTGEGADCDEDRAFRFRASGNEPGWYTVIRPEEIVHSRLGADLLRFPDPEVRSADDRTTMVARTPLRGGHDIEIHLDRARCRDTMSGAVFPYTAEVRLDGNVMTGCAMKGAR